MKVALVNPNSRAIGRIATTNPPLGILYIAAYLEEHGIEVRVLDADVDNLSNHEVFQRTKECDLVGTTMVTVQAAFAYDQIRNSKTCDHDLPQIVGGAHPSGMRERIFTDCPEIDCSIIGEGELTALELCKALRAGKSLDGIKGLCIKKGDRATLTGARERLNPDDLPFPAVDLVRPLDRYTATTRNKRVFPPNKGELCFPVMGSRGCPFHCHYCGTNMVWEWGVRFRSPKRICDEIEWLENSFGVDEIMYWDDELNINHSWFKSLCHHQIKRKLNERLWFKGSIRANRELVSDSLLKLAKYAGFWALAFGVESGNQIILDSINKGFTLQEVENLNRLLRKIGFTRIASFMIGHIHDTEKTIHETIKFANKLNVESYDFFFSTPLPGTILEKEATEHNLILSKDWRDYAMEKCVCKTLYVEREQLESLRRLAYLSMQYGYWRTRLLPLARKYIPKPIRHLMGKVMYGERY